MSDGAGRVRGGGQIAEVKAGMVGPRDQCYRQ